MGVVSSASKFEVLGRRRSTARKGHDVVELQPAGFAASAIRADEGTASFVARPHRASDRGRHMSRHRCDTRPHLWATGGGTPRLLELVDEHREGPVDDEGRIAARHRVAQQVAGAVEPGPRLAAQGDFEEVAIGGERSHDGTRRRGRQGAFRAVGGRVYRTFGAMS
jgi:hypothetical protein